MDPFTNNFKFDQTAGTIVIPLIIPPLSEFTREPVTLGDHLRRRRIELGLYQKDVAARLGVTTPTIWNWENRGSVNLRFIPQVIDFLGYNPIPQPEDLLEKLAWYKQVNGLTLEQLGVEMERDPEQLADWLGGRHKPYRRNREEIDQFLLRGRASKGHCNSTNNKPMDHTLTKAIKQQRYLSPDRSNDSPAGECIGAERKKPLRMAGDPIHSRDSSLHAAESRPAIRPCPGRPPGLIE